MGILVKFTQKLQSRLITKHDKENTEGRALRALREIRVRAAPAWDSATIEIFFLFIREEGRLGFEDKSWGEWLELWLALVPTSGRFQHVEGQVATLGDLTAEDYVESDPLDLDHLSTRNS